MDLLPAFQEKPAMVKSGLHRASDLGSFHAFDPNQLHIATGAHKIDLRLPVSEDMDMSRFMISDKNDDTQAKSAQDSDHKLNNLS
jgi:hypothetical protein